MSTILLVVSTNWWIYAFEGQILIIALPWHWIRRLHTLFLWSLSVKTGKKVAGPAESGSSQSVRLARNILKVILCIRQIEKFLDWFFLMNDLMKQTLYKPITKTTMKNSYFLDIIYFSLDQADHIQLKTILKGQMHHWDNLC